jgi:hypothetical protein
MYSIYIRRPGPGLGVHFVSAKKEKRQNCFPKKKKQPKKTAGKRKKTKPLSKKRNNQ